MRRISSKTTFFYKRIFPIFWFGFLAVFVGIALTAGDQRQSLLFLIVPTFLAVVGYVGMKMVVFDLVDQVFDEGESVLIRNNNREERTSLSDIDEVSYAPLGARMTLTLKRPSAFGTEIAFLPLTSGLPFVKHATIRSLIKKVDARRAA